jgi:TRAP-type mannitol/chloroaromatic compound transport system substrate-binding protein
MAGRRCAFPSVLALLLAGGLLASASTAAETVTLRVQNTVPSSIAVIGPAMEELDRSVAALTEGTLRLRPYEPGALVPALQTFEAVAAGAVDAANIGLGSYMGKEPALAFFNTVPFGPEPAEYVAWLQAGGGNQLMDEILARHGLKALHCVMFSAEGSGWFRRPIERVEDLRGLKMRIHGLGAAALERLGVSTQLLAAGDTYPALERGVIDAAELGPPSMDLEVGMHELADHYYLPGWHQTTTIRQLVLGLELWDGLSEQHRRALGIACGDLMLRTIAESESLQAPALAELEGRHGVTLHRWGPEFLEAFEQAWQEVAEDYAARDESFGRVWESYRSFRETYALWKRLGYL